MISIAELAHQRDPEAIAEIIRQELQRLDSEQIAVEVAIADSGLELQIRTNSAIDKDKLLTLVRSELQNLYIQSVAKVKIYCWRNDQEILEPRLLWTEQFTLEPVNPSLSGTLDPDSAQSHIARSPEPQLSKHSVLQQAINKISPTSHKAHKNLSATELPEQTSNNLTSSSIVLSTAGSQKPKSAIANNYWQLLLVGLSIVLMGLGIGAAVRAITVKNSTEAVSSANPSINNDSLKNTLKNTPSQSIGIPAASTKPSPTTNRSSSPTALTPSQNPDESSSISSSNTLQIDETVVTLEKFNRIQKGMTIDQVDKVFGASGKVIAENNSSDSIGKVYSWKNPQGSNAIIEFKDGQVVAKAQAGL